DSRVRCQVALALGELDSDRIVTPLAKIALGAPDDEWTRLAVASALVAPEPEEMDNAKRVSRALPVLQAILQAPEFRKLTASQKSGLAREFAALTVAEPVGIKLAVLAQELGEQRPQMALLTGFADGLARKVVHVDDYFLKTPSNPSDPVLQWLREFFRQITQEASDAKASSSDRLAAIYFLSRVSGPIAGQALAPLLADEVAQEIRLAAIRALALQTDKAVPELLMKGW